MLARFAIALIAAPAVLLAAGSAMAGADRYGPPIRETPQQPDAAPRAYLSWPGKADAAPVQVRQAPSGLPQSLYEPTPAARSQTRPAPDAKVQASLAARPLRSAEAPTGFHLALHSKPAAPVRTAALAARPRPAPVSPPPSAPVAVAPRAAAPTPLPANPAPTAVAQNGAPPRFYSLHREFGVSPDPIPLPAQFFADSGAADLAGPPPPPAPHLIAGQSASSAANVQRAAAAANLADGDPTTSNASP